MPGIDGFEIFVNGVQRTFRDRKDTAYEAARYLKSRHPKDIVEIVDCATRARLIVFEDGRVT